jgi:ubiquinone/menaquinone biosynthesis C-methylase UbiE
MIGVTCSPLEAQKLLTFRVIYQEQLWRALKGTGTLIAVDSSAAMLSVAARKFPVARVHFLHSSAETIDGLLPEASVDVIVCNSAFWQTHMQDTLRALHRILKRGARFLFNFSLARFSDTPVLAT